MTNNNRLKFLAAAILSASTATSIAAPFNSFDPRSMVMGSIGVTASNGNTAPLFNPALLAIENGDEMGAAAQFGFQFLSITWCAG